MVSMGTDESRVGKGCTSGIEGEHPESASTTGVQSEPQLRIAIFRTRCKLPSTGIVGGPGGKFFGRRPTISIRPMVKTRARAAPARYNATIAFRKVDQVGYAFDEVGHPSRLISRVLDLRLPTPERLYLPTAAPALKSISPSASRSRDAMRAVLHEDPNTLSFLRALRGRSRVAA